MRAVRLRWLELSDDLAERRERNGRKAEANGDELMTREIGNNCHRMLLAWYIRVIRIAKGFCH